MNENICEDSRAEQKARRVAMKPYRELANQIWKAVLRDIRTESSNWRFRVWFNENKSRILANQERYRQQADEFFAQANRSTAEQLANVTPGYKD